MLGEVFLGPPSEPIVGLVWPEGETEESLFYRIVSEFEGDLLDWRTWERRIVPAEKCSIE
jgi:hypothetical protein